MGISTAEVAVDLLKEIARDGLYDAVFDRDDVKENTQWTCARHNKSCVCPRDASIKYWSVRQLEKRRAFSKAGRRLHPPTRCDTARSVHAPRANGLRAITLWANAHKDNCSAKVNPRRLIDEAKLEQLAVAAMQKHRPQSKRRRAPALVTAGSADQTIAVQPT
jgi:hypothetical protein